MLLATWRVINVWELGLKIVLGAVIETYIFISCPALWEKRSDFLAWRLGLYLAIACLSYPNAQFLLPRWDALPSWLLTLLLLSVGNIFKTPCVSAMNILILQVQLQCHLFFGAFLKYPKAKSSGSDLWRHYLVSTSLWGRCYIPPCSVAICGYLLPLSGQEAIRLNFGFLERHVIVPVCCMHVIPFGCVDLRQIHSGANIAGLDPGWWSASNVVW